jgi:hypothetical protein
MCYNLCRGMLELAKFWNLGYLVVSLSIYKVRFPKKLFIWSMGKPATYFGTWTFFETLK